MFLRIKTIEDILSPVAINMEELSLGLRTMKSLLAKRKKRYKWCSLRRTGKAGSQPSVLLRYTLMCADESVLHSKKFPDGRKD
jgi:hypothetical protein